MRKNVIGLVVLVLLSGRLLSQQMYQFNQFLFNEMILNPAATGSSPCNTLVLDFRKQWLGMEGAPQTQNISFGGTIKKGSALGGTFYNDVAGAFRMTGVELDYAFHLFRDKKQYLSVGIGPSIMQYAFDGSGFKTELTNDPAFNGGFTNLLFDLATGIYYKNNYFLVSLGAKNLFESTIYEGINSPNRLVRNLYLGTSYNIIMGTNTRLEPSLFLRSIGKPTPQIDYSLKLILNHNYWFGIGARMNDALIAFAGFDYKNFTLGYGFEHTTSSLRAFNTGSHELVLRYKFCRPHEVINCINRSMDRKRQSRSLVCPVW